MELLKNFPFNTQRNYQESVLGEISSAFNSGFKHIILEAPTGFGKSAVAVSVALSLGSSYICTATKDLQDQYSRDFPFIRSAKGKSNFRCMVKQDFIDNDTYRCGICATDNVNECYHTSVEYGPCMTDDSFKDDGCKYKTFIKDYKIISKGTKNEEIRIDEESINNIKTEYNKWFHLENLKQQNQWRPCEYFDQLNTALSSSHSIFNYSIFLSLLPNKKALAEREILVLDEGHLLETEIVKFRGLTISKRRWKRYIHNLEIVDYGYDDIERWIEFLIDLETAMLKLTNDDGSTADQLYIERKVKYNYIKGKYKDKEQRKRIVPASELFDSDRDITNKFENKDRGQLGDELVVDAKRDIERLTRTINSILENPKNWIVSEIRKEDYKVVKVELKPLDTSLYCQEVFQKGPRTLIMSATILNYDAFCNSIGIKREEAKFIQVPSDFPIKNRSIYPLNIAYLNYNNLHSQDIILKISKAIDNLLSIHKKDKGIIHTTSYEQLEFIKENISRENSRRLLITDPDVQREEIISQHLNSSKPTVLISPSLHTGLDLKDDLSRFQIITKVPYPNKSDRWTNAKRELNEEWYYWQTALKIVQAYGRSVRSKEDWAKTYILDSAFGYFIRKNRNIMPKWFLEAIKGQI